MWDYLDGELPPEQMAALAAHVAECARCYPHYRFEVAFLKALARQRDRASRPPPALVEQVRLIVFT